MIICGDSLTELQKLPSASVHCCVTSPPYWGLRDYGVAGQVGLERTPEEYVASMVAVFREVRRVLRDDGTLWLNLGDSYAGGGPHHGENNTGKSGTNRGSITGKDRIVGGAVLSRNLLRGELAAKIPSVKDCLSARPSDFLKPKDLVGIPWRVAFALQADGWYLRSDIIWAKPNPMPESVTDRPTKAHEYLFMMAKSQRYYYDAEAISEPAQDRPIPKPENKTKKRHGTAWLNNAYAPGPSGFGHGPAGRNRRSVWTIATRPYSEAHFATFPEALVEPCIKAGCPAGGVVLDPFFGAGTTGLVAMRLGREFVGIELNPAYVEIAQRRIYGPMYQEAQT